MEDDALLDAVEYAQHWVGLNQFCSDNMELEGVAHEMYITYKDVYREGVRSFEAVERVDPTATHALEHPRNNGFYPSPEETVLIVKDLTDVRNQLKEFFGQPFASKYMYFVTRFDFVKPNLVEEEEDEEGREAKIDEFISFYVAVCGDGSVLVPMAVFPPVEEGKKPVKLRRADSVHRAKMYDPDEALRFFSVTCKKFLDKEARAGDKYVFLLDHALREFCNPEFENGVKALDGYGSRWTTIPQGRNPIRLSNFEYSIESFVNDEWSKILHTKKSGQPRDHRKCVAFWFFSVWSLYSGVNARASFRGCNMYLEDKQVWKWGDFDDME